MSEAALSLDPPKLHNLDFQIVVPVHWYDLLQLRPIWEKLGSRRQFADWWTGQLHLFLEDYDYGVIVEPYEPTPSSRNKKNLWVTLETARGVCQQVRTAQGMYLADYLTSCEHLSRGKNKPITKLDLLLPYTFYLIEMMKGSVHFLKFGVTSHLDARLAGLSARVLHFSYDFSNKPDALAFETMFKTKYPDKIGYARKKSISFSGDTETLPMDCLQDLLQDLKELNNN